MMWEHDKIDQWLLDSSVPEIDPFAHRVCIGHFYHKHDTSQKTWKDAQWNNEHYPGFHYGYPTCDWNSCLAGVCLKIFTDTEYALRREIIIEKGNRLKTGISWMGRAEDIVRQMCELIKIIPGADWVIPGDDCVPEPPGFRDTFCVIITLDRHW